MSTVKLCECGCGQFTLVSETNDVNRNRIKGQPMRFIKGHFFRKARFVFKGSASPSWKGGRVQKTHGYIAINQPLHPSADLNGYIYEHTAVAEKALGTFLPLKAEIHHINEIRNDNRNSNLIICQDHAYHLLLHARLRAFRMTGNANVRKCWICKQYDKPENLCFLSTRRVAYHRECNKLSCRERLKVKRGARNT